MYYGRKQRKHPVPFCGTSEVTLEKGQIIIPEALLRKLDAESSEENMQRLIEPYLEDKENLLGLMTRVSVQ